VSGEARDVRHLCHEASIGEGRARGFDPYDTGCDTVFVARHDGRLRAWRNACPHIAGAPMAWRRDEYLDAGGRLIACHAHGARFDPDTGLCIRGPCVGLTLQPLALEIDAHGEVFVQEHAHEERQKEEQPWQR